MTNEPNKHPMAELHQLVLRARKNQQKREEEELEKKYSQFEFLNEKHKELSLKSMKAIQEMKKTPANYEEEFKRHVELQKKAAKMEEEYLKNKT